MFSRIRKWFTYANIAMSLALVFAMSGGAYAASKYVISSTKQISPKVLKSLQGKAGTNGASGPAGPAGAAGPTGAPGEKGAAGANGTNGTNGTNGESVASAVIAKNAHCTTGGAEFKVSGNTTYACNGATGPTGPAGPTGSPWTAGGTLPTGATETGQWTIAFTATAAKQLGSSAFSFTIPLAAEPEQHFIGKNEELAGEKNEAAAIKEGKCKGEYAKPEAESGNLCVFTEAYNNAEEASLFNGFESSSLLGLSPRGDSVITQSVGAGEVLAVGSWAVTG